MRKKLICLAAALLLCAMAPAVPEALAAPEAPAEGGTFALRFDEGFTMSLPEGWVSYPAGNGPIRYALGPGDGARFLYIQVQPTDIDNPDAMREAIEKSGQCGKTSPLELNGKDFAAFVAPDLNASGCATIHDGQLITFLFTPQDDSDYMLVAAEIMAGIKF